MKNQQVKVPQKANEQWSQSLRNGKKFFQSKITLEQFELINTVKLFQKYDLQQLLKRSINSIPKTPKVVLLGSEFNQIFILVQVYNYALSYGVGKILLLTDFLQLVKDYVQIFACLYRKYGAFNVSEFMMGFNKNMEPLAWINEEKLKNEVQYQMINNQQPEKEMIRQIVALISKYSNLIQDQLQLQNFSQNFSAFDFGVSRMISRQKLKLIQEQPRWSFKSQNNVMRCSPNNSPQKVNYSSVKSPKKQKSHSKSGNLSHIPKFIKSIKEKKKSILDNLNHRRTFTFQNSQSNSYIKFDSKINQRDQSYVSQLSNKFSKVKSLNNFPLWRDRGSLFSNGQIQKYQKNPIKIETAEMLTSSGSSSNYIFKKKQFSNAKLHATLVKPNSDKNIFHPFSTTGNSNLYKNKDESYLFRSFQKMPNALQIPLSFLCSNTTQSKYFTDQVQQIPVVQQLETSPVIFKTIQQEVNDFFSNRSKSPRNIFDHSYENEQLNQQFGRLINF